MRKYIISRLSMKLVKRLFWDNVESRYVNQYKDKYGTYWMAISKYGFRVKQINTNK